MERRAIDLLIYRDLSDTFTDPIAVGDDAAALGFPDRQTVAIGPPIHGDNDMTVVVSDGPPARWQRYRPSSTAPLRSGF